MLGLVVLLSVDNTDCVLYLHIFLQIIVFEEKTVYTRLPLVM